MTFYADQSLLPGFEEFESSTSAPPPKKKKVYKKAPEPFTTYYDDNPEDDGDLSNQLKNRKRKRSGKIWFIGQNLQKSEFLKLIISFIHYFWCQN